MTKEDHFATLEEEFLPQRQVQYPSPMPNNEAPKKLSPPDKLPYPNRLMTLSLPPPGWVGNFRREHDQNAVTCCCHRCYIDTYPFLVVGEPVQVHAAYPSDSPQMQEVVGLYDHRVARLQVECRKCKLLIDLEGDIADKYNPDSQSTIHVRCLPEEERKSLEHIGYSLEYLITKIPEVTE